MAASAHKDHTQKVVKSVKPVTLLPLLCSLVTAHAYLRAVRCRFERMLAQMTDRSDMFWISQSPTLWMAENIK